jgi:NAD(P)H-flavin reductase
VPEPAEIVARRTLAPGVHAFALRLVDPAARPRFAFVPGQFDMVYVPGVGEVAISISSDPDDELLEHTIRIVGRTTRAIDALGPGDVIGLRGPFGRGWPLDTARGLDVVVVTGGLGCAPVGGAVDYVMRRRAEYGHVTVLHGVKKPADLAHGARFEAWRSQPDTTVLLTTDQPDRAWRDRSGVVTELFDLIELDPARSIAFLCGPEAMLRFACAKLRHLGLADARIFVSLERNMHCAVGLCGHCQLGPAFVCKDGPVIGLDVMAPYLRVPGL